MNLKKETNVQVLKDHPSILNYEGLTVLCKVGQSWTTVFINGTRWDDKSPIELEFYHDQVSFDESDFKEFYILPKGDN